MVLLNSEEYKGYDIHFDRNVSIIGKSWVDVFIPEFYSYKVLRAKTKDEAFERAKYLIDQVEGVRGGLNNPNLVRVRFNR